MEMTEAGTSCFSNLRVIDGGLASELERRGARIDGPLWSAHVLEEQPELLAEVHRTYIEAGAQCIATCSYQVSRMGYTECGYPAARADAALLRAVEIARRAAAEFSERPVAIAASLGPYGAALHNGAEYHGNYDCTYRDLVAFHRERIAVLAGAAGAQAPDLLAFETLPSLAEARAIGEALRDWPGVRAWFSFSCRDGRRVAHGELLRDCAAAAAELPQTIAIGVNCIPPAWVLSLIGELRAASNKPAIVYPNSGEAWNANRRCWTGASDPRAFGEMAKEWFEAGAQIVGGCCRTGPEHIREVARGLRMAPN